LPCTGDHEHLARTAWATALLKDIGEASQLEARLEGKPFCNQLASEIRSTSAKLKTLQQELAALPDNVTPEAGGSNANCVCAGASCHWHVAPEIHASPFFCLCTCVACGGLG
jgi:hypothetical protein